MGWIRAMKESKVELVAMGCYALVLLGVAGFWLIVLYFIYKTLQHLGIL